MPSIMTLQGPRLNAAPALPSLNPTVKPWIATIGGLALLGVAFVFWQHGKGRRPRRALRGPSKRKPKGKLTVFEHEIDLDTGNVQRVKQSIDTATPGDYGADPIGDGMFRMVPSGDIVDFEERNRRLNARKGLRGSSMLQTIAREAKTPEEFARRAEAWNAAERTPLPVTKLATAYKRAKPATVARLIREARETREEGRERLWSRMSKGLRSLGSVDVTEKQQRMFKRGVEAMKRAMKGTPDIDRAFNVAIRGSKDPDFAAGVRNAWNRVHPSGNREAAEKSLAKYGFKAG